MKRDALLEYALMPVEAVLLLGMLLLGVILAVLSRAANRHKDRFRPWSDRNSQEALFRERFE